MTPPTNGDRRRSCCLIVSANTASGKAEQAGIDLGGQRETLRKEIVDLAEAGQVGTPTKGVAFSALVDGAIAWAARAGELQGARAIAQRLKSEGDAKADEALTDLTNAEGEANANHFPAANGLLDSGKLKAERRAQAWPLIVRANAAARKAETAGLDFNNTRETQRLEIVGLADSNQFGTAESKTAAFEKLVDGAIAWPTRKGDIDKARGQAGLLKSGGDPTADGLLGGLKAAEDEAAAGHYAQAMTLLDPAIRAITERAPVWKLLRTHTVEMAKLKPRLDVTTGAGGIPGRGVGGHALATQWQGFDNSRAACPDDRLAGGIAPADLARRRTTLTATLNTLVNAYAARPVDATQLAWGAKEIAAREKQTAPLFQKVKYVTPKTEEQARLLKEFNALPSGGPDYTVLLGRLEAQVAKAEQLLAAVRNPTAIADEKAYFGACNKVRERIEAAIATNDPTDPTKTN